MEKQTWKKIEPQVLKPETKGDFIEGVLVGKIPKENGMSAKYYISNNNGEHFLWGSTILDEKLLFIEIGTRVKITFDGQEAIKENKMNLYTVEVAKKVEVSKETVGEKKD